MKVKKPQPMETEGKTPAPMLNKKKSFKKEKKLKTGKPGTLTSQLLDSAAATLATATPGERAERLAKAKARREKKRKKSKAAGAPKTQEKKKKKKEEEEESASTPAVPLSAEMKAELERKKMKKGEKKRRQKERKLAEIKEGAKEANVEMIKGKKKPLAVKINALQKKFGKQKEKIRLWKLNQKKNKEGKVKPASNPPENVLTKEEKAKKRNLKKKQRLARRKAEGVAVFKPRKGRKGKDKGKEEAMVE